MNLRTTRQACLEGLATLRSLYTPTSVTRIGPLEGLREDVPRKQPRKRVEFFADARRATEAIEALDAMLPRNRQVLSFAVRTSAEGERVKKLCKDAGYRLGGSEFVFARAAGGLKRQRCEFEIRQVVDPQWSARLAKAARRRMIDPAEFEAGNPRIRLYCAVDADRAIGWVQSAAASGKVRYVSNLMTLPAYRRRGVASTLMTRMLADDERLGFRWSVLYSAYAGQQLYLKLGYEQLGTLLMFWGRN